MVRDTRTLWPTCGFGVQSQRKHFNAHIDFLCKQHVLHLLPYFSKFYVTTASVALVIEILMNHFSLLYSFLPDSASIIQFWYDLLLTILKTAAVLFSAATVNETVNGLANAIRQVPSQCWNIETERLVEQVESQQVALSGKHLFKLTRALILAFAGTIVTLEIVLLDHQDKYEGNKLFKCDLAF